MKLRLLLLFVLVASAHSVFAQANPGPCSDAWISTALHANFPTISGSGTTGECDPHRYGGASWGKYSNSQALLNIWVKFSRICSDPWVGEAVAATSPAPNYAVSGSGTTGQCQASLYGSWPDFATLTKNVLAYRAAHPASTPVNAAPVPSTITVHTVNLISAMGAKCLGFANGTHTPGTQAILWNCGNQADQAFVFTKAGEIRAFGGQYFNDSYNGHPIGNLCLDINGGIIAPGRPVMIWPCNGQPNQKWSLRQGQLNAATNYQLCLAIQGGWVGFQVTQLGQCTQQPNQRFRYGIVAAPGRSTNTIPSGTQTPIGVTIPSAAVISNDGGSIVAQGGGNIVAQGGGNIVAQGGGNIVAQGGGNVVVPGGDTINTGN